MFTRSITTTNYGNLSNTTFTPLQEEHGIRNSFLGVTLLVLNLLIIILNAVTVSVIARFRHKNAIDIFVFTLALADLVKGLIPIPMTTFSYLTDWYLKKGSIECNFFGWIAFATNSGAMLILTFMSIERFWAVVSPFSYKKYITLPRVKASSIVAMTFSALHSAMPVFGVGRMLPYYDGAYSHFDYSRYSNGTIAYSLFIICYGYGMLFIVMLMYSFVFYKIRNLIHRHRRMSVYQRRGTNENELILKTEKMFSYLTLVLMILFMIGWLPFLIVLSTSQLKRTPPNKQLDLFAMRMAVITSLLNPIACAALCKPYRRGILYYFRMMISICGFKKPDSDIWDPWRRRKSTISRHRNDTYKGNNQNNSLTEAYSGSTYPNTSEYNSKHRIPSVLDSYDEYRRKDTLHETKEDEVTVQDDVTDTKQLIVHQSIDSGIENSPYTQRLAKNKKNEVTFNLLQPSLEVDDDKHDITKRRSLLANMKKLYTVKQHDENEPLIDKIQTNDSNQNTRPETTVDEQSNHTLGIDKNLDRYSARFTPEELVNALNDVIAKQNKNEGEGKGEREKEYSYPSSEFDDLPSMQRVRCFSEGRKQHGVLKPMITKDSLLKELEDSQNMINRLTEELNTFGEEIDSNSKTKINKNYTRNTVSF